MREIKFRGLPVDGDGWVYGSYTVINGETEIMTFFDTSDERKHEYKKAKLDYHLITTVNLPDEQGWSFKDCFRYVQVFAESVSQFTGLKDKNGVDIYEGDFLHMPGYYCEVIFVDGGFHSRYTHPEDGETLPIVDLGLTQMKVIGNIHEQEK